MPSHPRSAWEHLGELLIRRRIEMDSRYKNRRVFTAERAVEYRIVNAIELGRRDNYEPATIASLEAAYDMPPGSIGRILDGGDLVTLGENPRPFAPASDVLPPATPEMAAAMNPFEADVKAHAEAARKAHPGQRLTGLLVFPHGPDLARRMWDGLAAKGWPEEQIVAGVAYALTKDVQETLADARQGNAAGLIAAAGVTPP